MLLLALFPVSFFFLSPYSESMFLFASLLTFWWARRGRWGPAAAGGFVAALTRSVGVLLVPALLFEAWSIDARERPRAMVASLVPLLAPAAYAAYWFARAGDSLRPFHAQDSWFRSLEPPFVTLGNGLWLGLSGITDRRGIYWTVDLALTAVVFDVNDSRVEPDTEAIPPLCRSQPRSDPFVPAAGTSPALGSEVRCRALPGLLGDGDPREGLAIPRDTRDIRRRIPSCCPSHS